jgi:hypothetical protein
MRKKILAVPLAVTFVVTAGAPAFAVNCDQVNKERKMGRWPEDIALSMEITLADVKSCETKAMPASSRNAAPPKMNPHRTDPPGHKSKGS